MGKQVCYGSWQFEHDLRTATHIAEAEEIRFTRAERMLLEAFICNENHVLSRERLLDALSGVGSDAYDRRVDFIVNRLRRKLRDCAHEPTYISTQYGEGYRWIAKRTYTERVSAGAFIVVGPIHGLQSGSQLAKLGWAFTEELTQALKQHSGHNRAVELDSNCPPVSMYTGELPQYGVVLDFLAVNGGNLDCAVTLKEFRTGTTLKAIRIRIFGQDGPPTPEQHLASDTATDLCNEIWIQLNRVDDGAIVPYGEPLMVRLHLAAMYFMEGTTEREEIESCIDAQTKEHSVDHGSLLSHINQLTCQNLEAIKATEQRLRKKLHECPNDHETALFLAATLYGRYMIGGVKVLSEHDLRHRDLTEIENLVTVSLPHLKNNDILLFPAAKLLYFSQGTHTQTALDLAQAAFETTTALASAFTTIGQLRMWEGLVDEAVSLYDQGLELAESNSHFQRYLLVLKSQALAAQNERKLEEKTATELIKSAAQDQTYMSGTYTGGTHTGIFHATEDICGPRVNLEHVLDDMDIRQARAVAYFVHFTRARLFKLKTHRQNILRRPLTLLVNKFGASAIPEEVRIDAPPDILPGRELLHASR